jgi:hypothetical protein
VSDAEARLAEAKASAVSHDQMAGCTPRVIPPAFTTYPKHAREPFWAGPGLSAIINSGAQIRPIWLVRISSSTAEALSVPAWFARFRAARGSCE